MAETTPIEEEVLADTGLLRPEIMQALGESIVAAVNPVGRVEYLKAKAGEHKLAAAAALGGAVIGSLGFLTGALAFGERKPRHIRTA